MGLEVVQSPSWVERNLDEILAFHQADRDRRPYLHIGPRSVQRVIALLPSFDRFLGNFVPAHQHPGDRSNGTVAMELVGMVPSILQPPVPAFELGWICVLRGHWNEVG